MGNCFGSEGGKQKRKRKMSESARCVKFEKSANLQQSIEEIDPENLDTLLQIPNFASLSKDVSQLFYPFDCIGSLVYVAYLEEDEDRKYPIPGRGLGVLLSSRIVLTCAQNLYNHSTKSQYCNVIFTPHRSQKSYEIQSITYSHLYADQKNEEKRILYDYAVLYLKQHVKREKYPRIGQGYSENTAQKILKAYNETPSDMIHRLAYNEEQIKVHSIDNGIIWQQFSCNRQLFGGPLFLKIYDQYYIIGLSSTFGKKIHPKFSFSMEITQKKGNSILTMAKKLLEASSWVEEENISHYIHQMKPINFNKSFQEEYLKAKKNFQAKVEQQKRFFMTTSQQNKQNMEAFDHGNMDFHQKLNHGIECYHEKDYEVALQFFNSALEQLEIRGTTIKTKKTAYLHYLIGKCDFYMQRYERASHNMREAENIMMSFKQTLRKEELITIYCARALLLEKFYEIDEAIEYYTKALKLIVQLEGQGVKTAIVENNLGCLQCLLKNYKSSIYRFEEAIEDLRNLDEMKKSFNQVRHNNAVALTHLRNFTKAQEIYSQILEELSLKKDKENKQFEVFKVRYSQFLEQMADNWELKKEQLSEGIRTAKRYQIALGWYDQKFKFSSSFISSPEKSKIKEV